MPMYILYRWNERLFLYMKIKTFSKRDGVSLHCVGRCDDATIRPFFCDFVNFIALSESEQINQLVYIGISIDVCYIYLVNKSERNRIILFGYMHFFFAGYKEFFGVCCDLKLLLDV